MTVTANTFFQKIREIAAAAPKQAAFIDETREVSFAELHDRIIDAAVQLTLWEVTKESVIGISVEDEIIHMIICLAALTCDCAQISLPTHDAPGSRRRLANRAGVTHIICGAERDALSGFRTLASDALISERPARPTAGLSPHQGSLYLSTSGTTGQPNIIPFREAQVIQQALNTQTYCEARYLQMSSVQFNNAKRHRLYCLYQGGTNVIRPKRDSNLTGYITEKCVTHLWLSPTSATSLIEVSGEADLSRVRIRLSGSLISAALRSQVRKHLSEHLSVCYGATECSVVTRAGPNEHYRSESVGKPLPGVKIEVVDKAGKRLPAGKVGSIRIKAPGMATGYLDATSAANARFTGGWFYPGDSGTFDSNGALLVLGREDEMLILNGINIFPIEIEQALERHPAVTSAAAISVSSTKLGQIPIAAVELNQRPVSAHELQQFAKEQLGLRGPRKVIIMKEGLPRSPQGKVLKRKIAEAFAQGRKKPRV